MRSSDKKLGLSNHLGIVEQLVFVQFQPLVIEDKNSIFPDPGFPPCVPGQVGQGMVSIVFHS